MDDSISRQAAIEAIEKARANVGHNMERAVGAAFIEILDEVGEDIGRLPSAQFATDTNVGTKLGTNLAQLGTDCISRQTVLDAIDEISREVDDGDGFNYAKWREYFCELPSVLGTNLAEVGTDCISRQDALDICDHAIDLFKGQFGAGVLVAIKESIEELPSAEPQIIRCKDCKHWIPYDWMFSEVWQSKNIADYPEDEIGCDCSEMAMKANDFCSRGERRTE